MEPTKEAGVEAAGGVKSGLGPVVLIDEGRIQQFDFDFQPSVAERKLRELAFVERKENVLLLGPPGVGKTRLAIALGTEAIVAGNTVYFVTMQNLVSQFQRARDENKKPAKTLQHGLGIAPSHSFQGRRHTAFDTTGAPITLRFARQVGGIMAEAGQSKPNPSYM